jgi:diguanylate cyclase (GGDEF)-like protein
VPQVEQTPRILVVDDASAIRELLAVLLEGFGSVELAESGEEALQRVANLMPDLILLDVSMPGMDGYEVCRQLKENPATEPIPVVFLTALDTDESEELGLEIGATDFIRKPFAPRIVQARVSNVLNLQAATRQLELMASIDSLTGAFNRRHFLEVGYSEFHRSRRYNHKVCLLMIDFDNFKLINDKHGHSSGDEVLIQAVAVMHHELRAEDTLGRIGGEEFAIILPETGMVGAVQLAERLRSAVGDIVLETSTEALSFTISIGVAQRTAEELRIDETLKRADDALYLAKEQGRNRVVEG